MKQFENNITNATTGKANYFIGKFKDVAKIALLIAPLCFGACKGEREAAERFDNTRYVIKSYFEQVQPQKITWANPGVVALLTDLDSDGSYDLEERFVDYNRNILVKIKEGYENKIPKTPENLEKISYLKKENFGMPRFRTVEKSYFDNLTLDEKIKFWE